MTTDPSKDYYDILGVPKNATPEQIHKAYIKIVKDSGLDRLYGKENQYKDSGEKDLLKAIRTQIAIENERMKCANEAEGILSDATRRRDYDEIRKSAPRSTTSAPPPPPPPRPKPEIVLSTTSLYFRAVAKGVSKVKSFTVDNRGGAPDEVHIDLKKISTWGELLIEPDPIQTFPIKVTVKVKTGNMSSGYYTNYIDVIVDGEQYSVLVSLEVIIPAPATAPIPVSPPKVTTTTPRPRTVPSPAPVYTPPPATTDEEPWEEHVNVVVIVITIAVVLLVIILMNSHL